MPHQTGMLTTKVHRPRTSGDLVPRPRLLEHPEERRSQPLAFVCALAGYGKTTLARSWLDACECPLACGVPLPGRWPSLDEGDDDLILFLGYLLAAIETRFPGVDAETPALLKAASLLPLPVPTRSPINELGRVERPFILVLDDHRHIRSMSMHDLLRGLPACKPQSMHLLVISRTDPPLNLARLRARGPGRDRGIACFESTPTPPQSRSLQAQYHD